MVWALAPPEPVDPEVGETQSAKPVAVSSYLSPNQFTLFQLGDPPDDPVTDLHTAQPRLTAPADKPDVLARIDLVSFQIARSEQLEPGMQATLRLDMGEDAAAVGDREPLFWSIAAGLDLAAQGVSGQKADETQRSSNLSQAFRRRPIEVAGGLAQFKVELVAHPPLPWWRRMFQFASSGAVKRLVAAVGFPGIALDAVKLLDEALSRFEEKSARTILESRPLTLALTDQAANEFSAGLKIVKPAILNDGLFLLLRQGDADLVRRQQPIFLGGYGKLLPSENFSDGTIMTIPDPDPFADLSYAVLRVKTRAVAIEQSL
jgi:hypothetical protein